MNDVYDAIRQAITDRIPDARIEVSGQGGHFELVVRSPSAFGGLSRLQKQRLVLGAIAPLMAGDHAPVHAIDRLDTLSE